MFVDAQNPVLLDIENCSFENVHYGIWVRGYSGNRDDYDSGGSASALPGVSTFSESKRKIFKEENLFGFLALAMPGAKAQLRLDPLRPD
jgi:hypothetical protein